MFHSLKTRFVGGQEATSEEDGKVDYSEAVDGDDFVLVDVLPSPDQIHPAPTSGAAPAPTTDNRQHYDPNVITEEPTPMMDAGIVSGGGATLSFTTDSLTQDQQQAWVLRPQDIPFWLSSKLQALASCQRLAGPGGLATSDPALRPYARVGGHDIIDEQSISTMMSSPELSYDFELEKHVVAFDQSVFLKN